MPLLVGFSTFGCTQDTGLLDQAPNNPAMDVKTYGNLEFIYQVTDMEGNPQSTFSEGGNFMLSFVVRNHGEEDKMIFDRWDLPYTIDEFFSVYKLNSQGDEKVLIGKSFEMASGSYDLPGQWVPAHNEIVYQIPWLTKKDTSYIMPIYTTEVNRNDRYFKATHPVPSPLHIGRYFSNFTLEQEGMSISFNIEFTVK